MTSDDQADTGALSRREFRRLTGAVPVLGDAAGPVRTAVEEPPAADVADSASDVAVSDDTRPVAVLAENPAAAEATEGASEDTGDPVGTADAISAGSDAADADAAADDDAADADAHSDVTPADASDPAAPAAAWADAQSPATALLWVDPAEVEEGTAAADADAADQDTDLLAGVRRHGFLRAGILIPLCTLLLLVGTYTATTLLWPLHEVPPTVEAVTVEPATAETAALTWPAQGAAAVSVDGIGAVASTGDQVPIASITKVVSAMLVLDELPLELGEQGPEYAFDSGDSSEYWSYLWDNQSALDVPVGGTLTEYQMLQGVLLGSANNYIDRLADEIWGSEQAFADAAQQWLDARGLDDITVVTPSGRNTNNVASAESLTELAAIAMANPVFAEIVGTASVDLPGAGRVKNTNGLLGDEGVVGVKTGSLDGSYNLLTGKDITVGDTTVRVYASVLGQVDDETRVKESRALYTQVEEALQAQGPAVGTQTVVGRVSTPWGASVDVVSDADASVVLWNGETPTAEVVFDLGESTDAGTAVGTLTVTGPLDSTDVAVVLADDIEQPSAWWRLTHPLELFGITD